MKHEALFLNGVFEKVLSDIEAVQTLVPEQTLYLQPYAAERIVDLYRWNPSMQDAVALYISTTDALDVVTYVAEVVSIRDKKDLSPAVETKIDSIISLFQTTEDGLYREARGTECRNLLGVRGMKRLSEPFPVTDLVLLRTGAHPAGPRTTSGSWWYVAHREPCAAG